MNPLQSMSLAKVSHIRTSGLFLVESVIETNGPSELAHVYTTNKHTPAQRPGRYRIMTQQGTVNIVRSLLAGV